MPPGQRFHAKVHRRESAEKHAALGNMSEWTLNPGFPDFEPF